MHRIRTGGQEVVQHLRKSLWAGHFLFRFRFEVGYDHVRYDLFQQYHPVTASMCWSSFDRSIMMVFADQQLPLA